MSGLNVTGGNPEALTIGCAEDSRAGFDAQHWLWEQEENKTHVPWCLWKFLVHTVKELEMMLMYNKSDCAEIAHNKATVKRAAQLAISHQSQCQAVQQRK